METETPKSERAAETTTRALSVAAPVELEHVRTYSSVSGPVSAPMDSTPPFGSFDPDHERVAVHAVGRPDVAQPRTIVAPFGTAIEPCVPFTLRVTLGAGCPTFTRTLSFAVPPG